jgi:hypothetical protein
VSDVPETAAHEPVDVFLALTDDRVHTEVPRGENAGRRLEHVAVVRELTLIGRIAGREPFEAERMLRLPDGVRQSSLHAVVFVQGETSRKILGVARVPLARAPS